MLQRGARPLRLCSSDQRVGNPRMIEWATEQVPTPGIGRMVRSLGTPPLGKGMGTRSREIYIAREINTRIVRVIVGFVEIVRISIDEIFVYEIDPRGQRDRLGDEGPQLGLLSLLDQPGHRLCRTHHTSERDRRQHGGGLTCELLMEIQHPRQASRSREVFDCNPSPTGICEMCAEPLVACIRAETPQ